MRPPGGLRLAVLAQNSVFPLDNGAKIRNFHLFRALARRHEVTLLLTHPPAPEHLATLEAEGIRPVALSKPRSRYLGYLRSLRRGAPFDLAMQTNPAVRAWLRANAPRLDAILSSSIGPTLNIPREARLPVAVDTHNLEWRRAASDLAAARRRRDRLERRLRNAGTFRFEVGVLRAASRVYVCSADEAAMLERLGVTAVVVAPNGVDLDAVRPTPEPETGGSVLFAGDIGYPPNAAAAAWIGREIAPALRRRVPSCRIVVAGRGASDALRRELAGAGVEVHSPVPDMRDELSAATLALVPLRSGGGTRLKILEAFGAGRAVVSTTVGAEGIEAQAGRHLLLADGAQALADAAADLIDDPARRRAMAAEARALAEERYGWSVIGDAVADDLDALVRK